MRKGEESKQTRVSRDDEGKDDRSPARSREQEQDAQDREKEEGEQEQEQEDERKARASRAGRSERLPLLDGSAPVDSETGCGERDDGCAAGRRLPTSDHYTRRCAKPTGD